MHGQPENVVEANSGAVVGVERGTAGEALINMSAQPQTVDMPTALPDGTYTDKVSGSTFEVKGGKLTGSLAPLTSYILMK